MANAGIKSSYLSAWDSLRVWAQTRLAAVILLSFVLAVGFLLVILSCALWANWLPLLVGMSLTSPDVWLPKRWLIHAVKRGTSSPSHDIRPRAPAQRRLLSLWWR